jgi:hypothetical protein
MTSVPGEPDSYRREDHVGKIDEGLGIEAAVDGQADRGQEHEVAEAQKEGGRQEVDLGSGLAVVGAAPAFVAFFENKIFHIRYKNQHPSSK